jgi:hypothetical protein
MQWVDRGLTLNLESYEGWGWCCFEAELGKVKFFVFGALIGFGFGNSSPAEKNKVAPGLALGSVPIGGQGAFEEVSAPSFAEVLRLEASPSTTVDFPMGRLEDPLGKTTLPLVICWARFLMPSRAPLFEGTLLAFLVLQMRGRVGCQERGSCDLFLGVEGSSYEFED